MERCCIRQLCCPSIILYNSTIIACNHHTDIHPLLNIIYLQFSGAGRRLDGSSIQDQSQPPSHSLGYGIPSGAEQEQDDDPELAAAIAASLGGAAPSHSHISNSNSNFNPAVSGSSEDSFDADLAKALAMSQQESESVPTGPVKSDKEIAREKRLAALEKRGL